MENVTFEACFESMFKNSFFLSYSTSQSSAAFLGVTPGSGWIWQTCFCIAAAVAIAATVIALVYRRRSQTRGQAEINPSAMEMSDLQPSSPEAKAEENVYQVIPGMQVPTAN